MLRFIKISLILFYTIAFTVSCSENDQRDAVYVKKENIVNEQIQLSGLTCVGCEITVEKKLSLIPGVVSSKADYIKDIVSIQFDSTKTSIQALRNVLTQTNYKPE